ncbi:hypothetical protein ACI65C_011698 [Semiaphis heraclei]
MGDMGVRDATGLDGMMSRCVPFRTSRCGRRVPTRDPTDPGVRPGTRKCLHCPQLHAKAKNPGRKVARTRLGGPDTHRLTD